MALETNERPVGERAGFDRRLSPLVAFLLAAALLPVVTLAGVAPLLTGPLGLETTPWLGVGVTILGASLLLGLALAVLRAEGVGLAAVGLTPSLARRGVLWFAGVVLAVNFLLLVLGTTVADSWEFALAGVPPALYVGLAVSQWVFVGLAEELAGRAYLQNKLVALFGGERDVPRRAGAILVMAVLFALWHVPQRLVVAGRTPAELPEALLPLVGFALVLGVLYELTRNVVLVALVHGALNLPPIFLSVFGSESWQSVVSLAAIALPFLVGVYVYRRWLSTPPRRPTTPV
jgi:membrane protease YdiL (CAAX protease family)